MDAIFIGRVRELAVLRDAVERAAAGRPNLVLVEGGPGAGKSALVWRFLAEAPDVRVLHAGGEANEVDFPLSIVDQLLRTGPDADPVAAAMALTRFVASAADPGPVVLFVDDAQWADGASLAALSFMARRLREERLLIVLAAREGAPGVARLASGPAAERIRLDGLDAAELRDLVAGLGSGRLSARAVARLHAYTLGNPGHVTALVGEADPATLLADEWPPPAPRGFARDVHDRMKALPDEVERLVVAAAILGDRCSPALAGRLADVDKPVAALARAAGLLAERASPTHRLLAFEHPLIRSAVYHDLDLARRSRLHLRAAELVADRSSAWRHRIAATAGEDEVLAAEIAAFVRDRVVAGHYEGLPGLVMSAIRLSPAGPARESLLLRGAGWLLRMGDPATAHQLGDEIRHAAPGPHRSYVLGRLADSDEPAEELFLEAAELPEAAAALSDLWLRRGRPDRAVDWARRASPDELPGQQGPPVLDALLPALFATGERCEADRLAKQIPESTVDGLIGRARLEEWTGDLDAAHRTLRKALDAYGESARPDALVAETRLAEVLYLAGVWTAASEHAARAAAKADDTRQHCDAHAVAARIAAGRGDWETARRHSRTGLTDAWIAHARNDPAAVLAALEPIRPDVAEELVAPGRRVLAVEALTALGRLDEAAQALAVAEARAQSWDTPVVLAEASRARAGYLAAIGDQAGATRAYQGALDLFAALPSVPVWQRTLTQAAYGRFLRRIGKRSLAVSQLTAARTAFTALGARPYAARCAEELDRSGLTPGGRGVPDIARLTPQELSTARMAAAGMTNRQVAQELVVSVKTVEYHLGNVYAKLGLTSRTQLVHRLPDQPGARIPGVLPGENPGAKQFHRA